MSDQATTLSYASPREPIYLGSRVSIAGIILFIVGLPLLGLGVLLFVYALGSLGSSDDFGPEQYLLRVMRQVAYLGAAMIVVGSMLLIVGIRRIRQKIRRFGQLAAYRYNPPLQSEDSSHGAERR